ncbi:MAG: peroxiredoxin family protein [Bacteroidales bacterium]
MRKTRIIFALLGVLLFTTSFVSKDTQPGIALSPGSRFPELLLTNVDSLSRSSIDFRGNYTLVQFWGAYQAASRVDNVRLSNAISRNGLSVEFVSVCMDPIRSIGVESARIDGISKDQLFYPLDDQRSKMLTDFALKERLTNYLIDPHGVIVAKNITKRDLMKLQN